MYSSINDTTGLFDYLQNRKKAQQVSALHYSKEADRKKYMKHHYQSLTLFYRALESLDEEIRSLTGNGNGDATITEESDWNRVEIANP